MIHIACFGPFNIARLARRRWSRLVAQLPAMRCHVPDAEDLEKSGSGCELPITIVTLWWTYKKLWKMAIEIVDFPMKNSDFPLLC